jgi:hypothetical protein
MGETNEAPSWIAEGDELSLQKQGSIESIISLPQSVACTSNTPYTAGLEMQHEQLNADLLEAAASEQYYPTPKGSIHLENELTVNHTPLHENSGDGKCTVIQNVRETSLKLPPNEPREESYDYSVTLTEDQSSWKNSRKGLRKLTYVNHNKTKMSIANNRRRKTDS